MVVILWDFQSWRLGQEELWLATRVSLLLTLKTEQAHMRYCILFFQIQLWGFDFFGCFVYMILEVYDFMQNVKPVVLNEQRFSIWLVVEKLCWGRLEYYYWCQHITFNLEHFCMKDWFIWKIKWDIDLDSKIKWDIDFHAFGNLCILVVLKISMFTNMIVKVRIQNL